MFADFPAPPPPADIRFDQTVNVSSEPADFSNRLSLPGEYIIAAENSGDPVTWPDPNTPIASNVNSDQAPAIALLPSEQTPNLNPSTLFDFSPIWPTNRRFYSVPERFLITQSRDGQTEAYSLASTIGIPIDTIDTIEVFADRQEYDQLQNLVKASGDVLVNFANSILAADELEVDLNTQLATANGNVVFTREQQIVKGEKFEYRFGDNSGIIYEAKGELSRPNVLNPNRSLSDELYAGKVPSQSLSDRLFFDQPVQRAAGKDGFNLVLGSVRNLSILDQQGKTIGGGISGEGFNRFRFEADTIEFNDGTWLANNIRLTNDPFSPPELEVRADTATFQQVGPNIQELVTTKSRLVWDQKTSIPLLKNRFVFDANPRSASLLSFGFDGEDRGGLYIEREFDLIRKPKFNLTITPQYYLQEAAFPDVIRVSESSDRKNQGDLISPSLFGAKLKAIAPFSPRTNFLGTAAATSFDAEEFANELETSLNLNHKLGNLNKPHNLSLQYNYRDLLFNGSLGFQRVRSSLGMVVNSPNYTLGQTGINFSYQGSIQSINADTDRLDLLSSDRTNNRVRLGRYQGAILLNRGFNLWQGQALPPTREEGLTYTPVPITPYVSLFTGLTGVYSAYSNGAQQQALTANLTLQGQIGNFSDRWFDYTGFNFGYSQAFKGKESPFLFDRIADRRSLSWGISQQIYGPIRAGFQTSRNLDTGGDISTDYFLEYSRRTHNIVLRYNPVLSIGSINLRISDFSWDGFGQPFDDNFSSVGAGIGP